MTNTYSSFSFKLLIVFGFAVLAFAIQASIAYLAMGEVLSYGLVTSDTANFVTLEASDAFGYDSAIIGDLDGNGIDDLVVGSKNDDDDDGDGGDAGLNKGAVYILFLETDFTVKTTAKISDTAGGFTNVLGTGDKFGSGVEGIGDFNGDDVPDIAVAANGDDDVANNAGAIYLIYLTVSGTVSDYDKLTPSVGVASAIIGDGGIANMGDLDGDGTIDLATSTYQKGTGNEGAVYILFLNSDGTIASEATIDDGTTNFSGALSGDTGSDLFGVALDSIPDMDADGNKELLVGSYYGDDGAANTGAAYVIFLNDSGGVKSYGKISAADDLFSGLVTTGAQLGNGVAYIGDMNADGSIEVAIGAAGYPSGGAVFITTIDSSGEPTALLQISSGVGGLATLDSGYSIGAALDGGDLNGDGLYELSVGLPSYDPDALTGAGGLYVFQLAGAAASANQQKPDFPGEVRMEVVEESVCPSSAATVRLTGTGVDRYILSTDSRFLDSEWVVMNGSPYTTTYRLPSTEGTYVLYAMLRNSISGNASQVLFDTVTVENGDDCVVEEVQEDPTEEDLEAIDATTGLPVAARSPITGDIEYIDDVFSGDLVVSDSFPTVYLLERNQLGVLVRKPFLNEEIYSTWYSSFDNVVRVNDATLTVLPVSVPMLPKTETTLIGFEGLNSVFVSEGQDELRIVRNTDLLDSVFAEQGTFWQQHVLYLPVYFARFFDIDQPFDHINRSFIDAAPNYKIWR